MNTENYVTTAEYNYLKTELDYYKGLVLNTIPSADSIIAHLRGENALVAPQYGVEGSRKEVSIQDLLRVGKRMAEADPDEKSKEGLDEALDDLRQRDPGLEQSKRMAAEVVGDFVIHIMTWDRLGLDVEEVVAEGVENLSKITGVEVQL